VTNTEGNARAEERAISMMLQYNVRGILYSRWYHHEVRVPPSLGEAPSVLVNCFDSTAPDPAVVPDEFAGGRQADNQENRSETVRHGQTRSATAGRKSHSSGGPDTSVDYPRNRRRVDVVRERGQDPESQESTGRSGRVAGAQAIHGHAGAHQPPYTNVTRIPLPT